VSCKHDAAACPECGKWVGGQLAAALAKVAELEKQLRWSREHEEDLVQENDNLRAAARRAAVEYLEKKEKADV
jgi:Rad3-related DNA helicase